MSVIGIGVDIVDIRKMKKILSSKPGADFLKNTFTENELDYAKGDASKLASTFAVKEAAYKAFGTGWIDGRSVEVLRKTGGVPRIRLSGEIRKIAKKRKVGKIFPSISRTDGCTVAIVLVTS